MHADRRRGAAVWAGALTLVLLVTGCASMPGSGEVRAVEDSPRAEADSQVRVFGVKPQPGEQPESLVRGFLEATTSDEADYRTARDYLTEERARSWQPEAGITVLSSGPSSQTVRERVDMDSYGVQLSGTKIASVDAKHSYTPRTEQFQSTFRLKKERGEWRIDTLPNGLVLSEADFQRIYRSVNMYYFAAVPEGANAASRQVLVPDPVYLRRRIDPLTSTVKALLDGPTDWLAPVVTSQFPPGTALRRDGLEVGDSERLRVRLSDQAAGLSDGQCERMAAQLLKTVQDQAATKVDEVQLAYGDGDTTACSVTGKGLAAYGPQQPAGAGGTQYFIDGTHKLVSLSGGDKPDPVSGPFGEGPARLQSAAVRLDEQAAAGVAENGRSLYVADLATGSELGGPRLRSKAAKAEDGLSAPSWDGHGDLWVADRDPGNSRLLVLRDDKTVTVHVPGLGGGRIQSLRVAPDGARIALLVREGDRTTLQLGRVLRQGTAEEPEISVTGLRPVAPKLEDVAAASWAGVSRIVVVGRESEGVQQLQFVDTDGSTPFTPALPGISGVKAVAASPLDQNQPLLADSEGGIYRLPSDSNWKAVEPKGTAPVYPG